MTPPAEDRTTTEHPTRQPAPGTHQEPDSPATARSRPVGLIVTGVVVVALVALAATALAGVLPHTPTASDSPGPDVVISSPTGFFVDTRTAAAAQVHTWQAQGRPADAAQLAQIAERPFPLWVTGDAAAVIAQVRDFTDRAAAAAQRPLLVAYNIPHRDCGNFSGGGSPDPGYYRQWISGLVAGLNGHEATVILEPDAVAHEMSGCLDPALVSERARLLGDAITALKATGSTVYLDAGNPGFITDTGALATALAQQRDHSCRRVQPQRRELLSHPAGDQLRDRGLRSPLRRALHHRHQPQRPGQPQQPHRRWRPVLLQPSWAWPRSSPDHPYR